ncbi:MULTISPECIES: YfjI family protein [Halocynthiibacter]|uniref:YfjI family protein n=1 Tax=Halocynthiibacter halioticoli TaxID=2986804 RepID=A0AAE3IZI6_9RHOB|nr:MULTISPECIES: YfjI family protein [Halocynthiibacter]MCV6824889.1 YfjI family protein [Halocynthiibacter halioticoli]MCW4057890.1 YfjI family protein [Halocynthiibacter sp. SDUM655004]
MKDIAQDIVPYRPEEPQPLLRQIPAGKAYPVEALGPLKEVVQAVQNKTQAPIEIAAQSALSIASLATQAFGDVEWQGGVTPCSLFMLTIAKSGERKSSCDKLLIEQVRVHERDGLSSYAELNLRHTTELKIWEKQHDKLLVSALSAKPAEKQAAEAKLETYPPAPLAPIAPHRIVAEPTFEGLVKLFKIGQPSLGLFTDEGGSFIGGYAMSKDNMLKTCSELSKLWDGSPISWSRSGDGTTTMYGRRLASHIMLQPVAARPVLANPLVVNQGFLARFLICEPKSAIGTRTRREYRPESDLEIAKFGKKLQALLEQEPPLKANTRQELEPRKLTLTPEAKELLLDYAEATELGQKDGGVYADVTPFASKSAEQALRIAGVLTLWESLDADRISAETMARGIDLAEYYLHEAKRLVDYALVSDKTTRAEAVRTWLLNKWAKPEVLPSDVVQHGPNALRDTKLAIEALTVLEEHGWLIRVAPDELVRGARRKLAYRLADGARLLKRNS